METQAQAQQSAKAGSSSNGRIDAGRAARLAALEAARAMRVAAKEEMREARDHRKKAALKNAQLARFVENCRELGIDMSGVEVPVPANKRQSQGETSNGSGQNQAAAGTEAASA